MQGPGSTPSLSQIPSFCHLIYLFQFECLQLNKRTSFMSWMISFKQIFTKKPSNIFFLKRKGEKKIIKILFLLPIFSLSVSYQPLSWLLCVPISFLFFNHLFIHPTNLMYRNPTPAFKAQDQFKWKLFFPCCCSSYWAYYLGSVFWKAPACWLWVCSTNLAFTK